MATQYTAGLNVGDVLTAATMNSIGAAWESWTPQLFKGANVAQILGYCRYTRIQKLVVATFNVTVNAVVAGAAAIEIRNLPVTASNTTGIVGSWMFFESGVQFHTGTAVGLTTTSATFYVNGGGGQFGIAINNPDYIQGVVTYEGV